MPIKAALSHCLATATPPSSAASSTTRKSARRGSSPALAECGASRAPSWSAPALLEMPIKAGQLHCPATATPPLWAGKTTTKALVRRGFSPAAAAGCKSAEHLAGRHQRRWKHQPRLAGCVVRRRQHYHRGWAALANIFAPGTYGPINITYQVGREESFAASG